MQQGGQYGEVPPQFARPTASSAPTTGIHAHLFNLSHDVAAAAGGLGLSTNSTPSISHSSAASPGHHHHAAAAHPYSLGQAVHQHHHHSLHQQQQQQSTTFLHFQDHLSHHHHQQSQLQSSAHTSQQQQLVDQSAAAANSSSSSSAGLHLHQSLQKQGMVPSISMSVQQHASAGGQEGQQQQMQQTSILQQRYTPQQQHGLGLGLESKPLTETMQQAGARGVQQQQQQQHASVSASSQGATAAAPSATAASIGPATNVTQTAGNSLMGNSSTQQLLAGGTSTVITSNSTAAAVVMPSSMNNTIQQGGAGTVQPVGGSSTSNKQEIQLQGAGVMLGAAGSLNNMQAEEMQDALMGDELDMKGGSGGNRWPRQETLALLKVRSEMDSTFRDSSLKRPLWDEVSRKLAELGYHRSAKKCKEKFENVHKYYKRTKEGKAGRQDGKNYRFFSELEALYGNAGYTHTNLNINTGLSTAASVLINPNRSSSIPTNDPLLDSPGNNQFRAADVGRSSAGFLLGSGGGSLGAPSRSSDLSAARLSNPALSFMRPQFAADATGLNFSSETSSSDDDIDDEYEDPSDAAPESKKRKRKTLTQMMAFFESLLKQVMEKQEQMQQRFLEALEKREQDRMIREEAWKRQEMARMNRENDLRAQERSLAATRDAAIVTFLQKVTGQTVQLPISTSLAIAAQPVQVHPPGPAPLSSAPPDPSYIHHIIPEDQDPFDPNSKRWPKPEVLALIKLRTGLHSRFTEPGPKGPLWEDIAIGMARLGYNRNAKRCKEKWENINKYFKKAKESNKNRPENAKTCPYYHQLDALYKQGVLGSGNISSSIKSLPYKPSSDTAEYADNPLQLQQASVRGSREGDLVAYGSSNADQVLTIMPPPVSQVSTASDATTSTGNINALAGNVTSAATHLLSSSHPDSSTGCDMTIHKDMDVQATGEISPTKAVDVSTSDPKVAVEITATRADQLSEDITMQMQPGIDDLQHPRSSTLSQAGYVEHKVDLEQDARQLADEDEVQQKQHVILQHQQHIAAAQQAHMQQFQQERLPAALAQLAGPTATSFIANMLQKFSNDPAESNTSTTSTNQDH